MKFSLKLHILYGPFIQVTESLLNETELILNLDPVFKKTIWYSDI